MLLQRLLGRSLRIQRINNSKYVFSSLPLARFSTYGGAEAVASLSLNDVEPNLINLRTSSKKRTTYFLPFQFRKPQKRERYKIGKEIGRGHFAVVHEAFDTESNEMVAIKVMNKATCPRELCQRELKIMQELGEEIGHSRLTPIKDVYENEDRLFFVLELFRGGDFYEHVAKNGRMEENEAAVVIRKLIYALDALHRHGIIHRDIKLENILIEDRMDADGRNAFKIADFGFAKHVTEQDMFQNPAGTLGYAAPEVLERKEYGPACDIWSAGIVLYTLLAGYPPFPHKPGIDTSKMDLDDLLEIELEAIYHGRQKKVWNRQFQRKPWDTISLDAKRLISHMLTVDASKRYTCSQVLEDPWITSASESERHEYLNFE